METNDFKFRATVKALVLVGGLLLAGTVAAFGQQTINLTAAPAGVTTPDGTSSPMWGYSCGAVVSGSMATCLPLSGPTSPAASGNIEGVFVVNPGSGYTAAPTVTISGPTGTFTDPFTKTVVPAVTATAQATIANGQVTGIQILNHGAGYTSAPTVTITAPASGTTATATAAPAWSPVVITVPTGAAGGLQINLTNNLYSTLLTPTTVGSAPVNPIPTSIMIVGQVGGGLGNASLRTTMPSPSPRQCAGVRHLVYRRQHEHPAGRPMYHGCVRSSSAWPGAARAVIRGRSAPGWREPYSWRDGNTVHLVVMPPDLV